MNLNLLKNLYSSSPTFIKKIYSTIPFNLRNGKEYRQWRTNLSTPNIINRDTLATVKYAFENFSFYKELYKSVNLNEWENIPLLDKQSIQSSLKEFEKIEIPKFYVVTGGVTGKPATFYQSNNVWKKELAFVYDYFNQFGYKPNMKKASFRGGDFSSLKDGKIWKSNPVYNEMHFSPFHMNIDTISKYVSVLNKYKPLYFHGYPSAFITLASLMKKKGLKLNYKPKTFFLISENYNQKDIIFLKDFFESKISSFYGHSERLIFAIADNELKTYKPDFRYGCMELVDENGKIIQTNGKTGEIVGTSYDNLAMPLIRYKTGDFTYYTDFESKSFAQIQGKWGQNTLIGKNGEDITLTALNLHSPELDSFVSTQFLQKRNGIVEMAVISSRNITKNEIFQIEQLLSKRVGNLLQFKINIVDKLSTNERGKSPLIIKH